MASNGIMFHTKFHEKWPKGTRTEEMAHRHHAHRICPFSFLKKENQAKKCSKKNSNLNILTNVYIDILILISKSHTEV